MTATAVYTQNRTDPDRLRNERLQEMDLPPMSHWNGPSEPTSTAILDLIDFNPSVGLLSGFGGSIGVCGDANVSLKTLFGAMVTAGGCFVSIGDSIGVLGSAGGGAAYGLLPSVGASAQALYSNAADLDDLGGASLCVQVSAKIGGGGSATVCAGIQFTDGGEHIWDGKPFEFTSVVTMAAGPAVGAGSPELNVYFSESIMAQIDLSDAASGAARTVTGWVRPLIDRVFPEVPHWTPNWCDQQTADRMGVGGHSEPTRCRY